MSSTTTHFTDDNWSGMHPDAHGKLHTIVGFQTGIQPGNGFRYF